ncbi:hypothetical protein CWM57_12160 [Klebsiella sp. G-Nf4]|nr:hypothetical protein CWM64_12250 [Klebsiella sp. I-Nf8]PJX69707.1 hypothetical protein CWM57_12160 [Klebsiella sp. G-Nf4]PKJ76263.1 hypothetical protein CWM65_01300 [Klebsiella sp. J-Nf11]
MNERSFIFTLSYGRYASNKALSLMHNVHHPELDDFRYAGWLKAEEGIVLANIFAALLIVRTKGWL